MFMRRLSGFTLIEVLVTIAILVLIGSIVYVLSGPARQSGRQSVCAAQLRQLHQAVMLYSTDVDAGEEVPGLGAFSCAISRGGIDIVKSYAKSEDIFYCPEFPSEFKSKLGSSYFWKPVPPDKKKPSVGGYGDMLRRQQELIDLLGARFPMFTCTVHDELYYLPREKHIDPLYTKPYVVEVSVSGSIYMGRRPYMRGRLLEAVASTKY